MKKSIVLILSIILTISSRVGLSQESDTSWVVNELQQLRTLLLRPQLNQQEKSIEEKIKIFSENTLPFAHVGAFVEPTSGDYMISFNTGSYIIFSYLAEALFINTTVIKDSGYLFGYTRYLAFATEMGSSLITPVEFAQYYGFEDIAIEVEKLPVEKRRLEDFFHANIIGFILAHEIAHHVLEHTIDPDQSRPAKRKREAIADTWATEKMIQAGQIPIFAVFSLLIFNELDERSFKNEDVQDHPAGMNRAVQLTEFIFKNIKDNEEKIKSKFAGSPYSYDQLLSGADTVNKLIKERAATQINTDMNPKDWLKPAVNGDRFAQLKLAEYYSPKEKDEDMPGFTDPIALKRMLLFHKMAADNIAKFDYFDSAYADYSMGHMYAFRKGVDRDYDQACKYLKRSASKKYNLGVHAYQTLVKDNRCN